MCPTLWSFSPCPTLKGLPAIPPGILNEPYAAKQIAKIAALLEATHSGITASA